MKLLFDENLSRRLVRLLQEDFPGSEHVLASGLGSPLDEELFRLAAARGFVLVTQDKDFQELSALRGAPPKVVWLRLGNSSTNAVAALLRSSKAVLAEFVADPTKALLMLANRTAS
ncbi:MAG: DUF5615 family PIN-like protein [Planctomycetes bacterium]|nr:DUF5615 family PIN-like protein [Planctomycetota bacterium]MBZ0151739.1 DUF5615 family PIN-like protein [Planctomycetota bacterium]